MLATLLGVGCIGIWILPGFLYYIKDTGETAAGDSIRFLGFTARNEGFDPSRWEHCTRCYAFVIGARFLRMVVVVPLVEEIFWRGFLMRYLIAGDRSFARVPFGTPSWKAFGVTTSAFMLVHAKEDWLGALIFGSLMYFLCIRGKSLAACVWMHAVANLLLGIYVLKTRQWGFW